MKSYSDYKIDLMGKTGTQIKVLCPECSGARKKSNLKDLAVNTTEHTWYCHHCGWKGGLGGNDKVYTKPTYNAKLKLPEKVLQYFKERGISEITLESSKIGYGLTWMPAENKEVNAIQFPFYKNSVVVNIKYRDGKKNFRQVKNAEKCFYGFDNMTGSSKVLIITEGEIDTLSFLEAGFTDVVSMPDGAPSSKSGSYKTKFDFLNTAADKLKSYKKVILAVDSDEPGKVAEKELAERIGVEKCCVVEYPEGCKDANDVLVKHGRRAVKDIIERAIFYPIPGLVSPNDNIKSLEDEYINGKVSGLSTGWPSLNKYYTVAPGELTVVTGIPNHGKSNWLDCLMLNLISLHGWNFAVWSPENHPVQNHQRTLSEKITEAPFRKYWNDKFPRMQLSKIKESANFINSQLTFIKPPEEEEPTIDLILDYARMAHNRKPLNALVIDPYNELVRSFTYTTETQYISDMLGKLRRFGREHDIHIFIVAHPQKLQKKNDGTYDAPTMYDIAGSANWRNKADNGICVNRLFKDGEKDHVEIIVQKVRFRDNGKVGDCKLRYQHATTLYIDDLQPVSYTHLTLPTTPYV